MIGVATLHVRNVPPEVYEALRARAARNGRSINAEVIDVLTRTVRTRTPEELVESLERGRQRLAPIIDRLPDEVELIRRDRDTDHGRLA